MIPILSPYTSIGTQTHLPQDQISVFNLYIKVQQKVNGTTGKQSAVLFSLLSCPYKIHAH